MIDIREKIVCDRDLLYKKSHSDPYYIFNIPAGTPFYATDIFLYSNTLRVQGFAGYCRDYPIEWFNQWFPSEEYEEAYSLWKENSRNDKKSFIAGYILGRSGLAAFNPEEKCF